MANGNQNRRNPKKLNRECGNGLNSNGTNSSEHILMKIFRKDGPPLGAQFDSLPDNAFMRDSRMPHQEENRRAFKRRKVSKHVNLEHEVCGEISSHVHRHGVGKGPMTTKRAPTKKHGIGKGPMTANGAPTKKHGMGKGLMAQAGIPGKKHGIGKGLMNVMRVTNPYTRGFICGDNFSESTIPKKKKGRQPQQSVAKKLAEKEQTKRKTTVRCRKLQMERRKVEKPKQPRNEKCELALEDVKCLENIEYFSTLLDDEELELRELQAGPNPVSCSAHFPTNGSRGCSLCKDLLAKFPPSSVTMKLPLLMQPWSSSPELVSKLFKAFNFLCTYAITISMYSFTFDEFAQAVHDKDSILLGQVHVALLKLLLSDVEKELSRGFFSHASKNCKFLNLLHSLEQNKFALELWQKSLNFLTWTEILRHIFIAAGFGSKLCLASKGTCSEEVNLMEKYGLSSGTLKGDIFSILLTQGNSGMEVSELAKSSSIVELNHADTFHELENLITLTLSSDVTLFEKISSSGYRLRINASAKECEDCPSDSEDFGSVDDISEYESSPLYLEGGICKNKSDTLTVYNEIDESNPGEVWLLGLMEGEYSDLTTEEKLNALAALIDLLSAGSSIRMEDPLTSNPPTVNPCSGAKIKRSTLKQSNIRGTQRSCGGPPLNCLDVNTSEQPTDSLFPLLMLSGEEKDANMKKIAQEMGAEEGYLHPMQSIFLGSDRRYNRYWMFLGPCDGVDPGHRRIYFESSEDGHWEVIENREALCSLLASLDHRGFREACLLASLEKREAFLCEAMFSVPNDHSKSNASREASSSPVSDVDNQLSFTQIQNDLPEQMVNSAPSQAFDACIWKSFYNELKAVKNGKKANLNSFRRCDHCHDLYWRDEKHCRICHTTFELDFDLDERYAVHSAMCRVNMDAKKGKKQRGVRSSQLQALKAAIYAIESVVPEGALCTSWKRSAHNLWVNRLRRVSNLKEFLQVLADFVTAVDEDWFFQNSILSGSDWVAENMFQDFPTMPQTYSAVALWLVKLDLLVASHVERSVSK